MTSTKLELARAWADRLDREAFDELPSLIHPDCRYASPSSAICGPDAIVASYRDNAAWAHATFDSIRWESEVALDDDGRARITFIDITDHQGLHHVYRCQQLIRIGDDGLVHHIEHVPIPEEEAALASFFRRAGVERG